MRKTIVAGNWKMNASKESVNSLIEGILFGMSGVSSEVIVCAPFPYLSQVENLISNSSLMLGAQNLNVKTTAPPSHHPAWRIENKGVAHQYPSESVPLVRSVEYALRVQRQVRHSNIERRSPQKAPFLSPHPDLSNLPFRAPLHFTVLRSSYSQVRFTDTSVSILEVIIDAIIWHVHRQAFDIIINQR